MLHPHLSRPGGADVNREGIVSMKVILLDYVYKHGVAGEVIDVADGFARNFLIPKGLAVQATEAELKRAAKLREQAAAKRAALENKMNELAKIIDGVELIFGRRAASTGKLFGSVTTQEIADALLEKTGVDINRRRISQQGVRELGTHEVPVRLGTEISPVLKITVVREDELAEYLAKREREAAQEAQALEDSEDVQAQAEDMQTEVIPAATVQEAVEQLQQDDAPQEGQTPAGE
ncbi:MAG: 50S ribosomal protein L9 [Phototrophicales bacterium]|nr:MAG: 50S ribosomal protein L9 [Phototrophicales bacterium]